MRTNFSNVSSDSSEIRPGGEGYVPNFISIDPAPPKFFKFTPEDFKHVSLVPKAPLYNVYLREAPGPVEIPLEYVEDVLTRIFKRNADEMPYLIDDFVRNGEVLAGRYSFEIADNQAHRVEYDMVQARAYQSPVCAAQVHPASRPL